MRSGRCTPRRRTTDLRPGRALSAEAVAAEIGIPVELLRRITLAAGVLLGDDDYREGDVDTFSLFAGGAGMFGEEPTLQFTRAVGSSMARVADAAISLFLVNVEGPLRQAARLRLRWRRRRRKRWSRSRSSRR